MDLLKTLDFRNYLNPISSLLSMNRNKKAPGDMDHVDAHQHIVKSLQDFYGSDKSLDRDGLKKLHNLENKGSALQQELRCQYLKNHADHKHANETLWKEIHAYYWLLSHSYLGFIRQYTEPNRQGDIGPVLPAVTACALYYLRQQIKWDYFRKENIKTNMWERVHSLYLMAESSGFADEQVQIALGFSTTIHQEYTRILLMDLLEPTRLNAIQIEAMDYILDKWQGTLQLDKHFTHSLHTHRVDLGCTRGASRINPETDGVKERYWNMNGILQDIYHPMDKIEAMADGESFDPCLLLEKNQVVELFEFARKSWQGDTLQPPQFVKTTAQKAMA